MASTDPSAADGPVDEQPRGAESPEGPTGRIVDRGVSRTFPRDARLLNGRAYDAVFGDNRRVADRLWTVLVHRVSSGPDTAEPGTPADIARVAPARLGLAIAKKRARRAIDRNRIKRIARESFRHARATLAGHHVVVMNRDAATTASSAELRAALDVLWSRLLRQSSGSGERRSGGHRDAARSSRNRSSGGARSARAPSPDEPSGPEPSARDGSGGKTGAGRSDGTVNRRTS